MNDCRRWGRERCWCCPPSSCRMRCSRGTTCANRARPPTKYGSSPKVRLPPVSGICTEIRSLSAPAGRARRRDLVPHRRHGHPYIMSILNFVLPRVVVAVLQDRACRARPTNNSNRREPSSRCMAAAGSVLAIAHRAQQGAHHRADRSWKIDLPMSLGRCRQRAGHRARAQHGAHHRAGGPRRVRAAGGAVGHACEAAAHLQVCTKQAPSSSFRRLQAHRQTFGQLRST